MKFHIIRPRRKVVELVDKPALQDVYPLAGLADTEVDHGAFSHLYREPFYAYVTYEFSLMAPADRQSYFALKTDVGYVPSLMAGNVVFYKCDGLGETIDADDVLPYSIEWLGSDVKRIEELIRNYKLARPANRINNVMVWQWPLPIPHYIGKQERDPDTYNI